MDCDGQKCTRQLKRKYFDCRVSDPDSSKACLKKLKNGELGIEDLDWDYVWCMEFLIEPDEPEKYFIREDQNEYENEKEKDSEIENNNEMEFLTEPDELEKDFIREDQNEYENEKEKDNDNENEDESSKDPELCMFLENLTEHGQSYKLKISQNDEEIFYEKSDSSDCCDDLQTCTDDGRDEVTVSEDMKITPKAKRRLNKKSGRISTKKEVSKQKKINDHKTILQRPLVPGFNSAVKEEPVEYEKNVTTTVSDSVVVILDNAQNCSEVNNKQLAEKQPSLREKLMYILEHPYDEDEHKELSEYIEQEKPVSQLKPLRNGRSRLYANAGVNKSVLSYGPKRFQQMLNDAQKDPPKALNLLRMFRFWLVHVPNDGAFEPWRDKHMLEVRPREKNANLHAAAAFGG